MDAASYTPLYHASPSAAGKISSRDNGPVHMKSAPIPAVRILQG